MGFQKPVGDIMFSHKYLANTRDEGNIISSLQITIGDYLTKVLGRRDACQRIGKRCTDTLKVHVTITFNIYSCA